ncbi:EF-hand domain-containing protein [Blastochloris viridis]|uniref:EF hand n=2 Tax=Blastochloris viridis TaxID=1079 RepID=A0A0N7IUQ1_BLAVI|nr:EF-hand domain-containing protein [Blastochloris viridis]ALK09982.1 EF hand [Blastochloris viridis]CUU42645.1 EF hand [Blastochloris viridis]
MTANTMLQALTQASGSGIFGLGDSKSTQKKLPTGTNDTGTSSLESLFSTIDADADGKVTQAEFSSFVDNLVAKSDLLQLQEENQPPSAADIFAAADTDGSGGLSVEEFKADLAAHAPAGSDTASADDAETRFSRFDTNEDGVVSQTEFAAAFGPTSSGTATASQQPDLFALLGQAVSAYTSTSSSTNSSTSLGSLLKAA